MTTNSEARNHSRMSQEQEAIVNSNQADRHDSINHEQNHLSVPQPARFKLIRQTIPITSGNTQSNSASSRYTRRHRHSHSERRSNNEEQNRGDKSSSPSSTASDSAFSQSQTTLGSESDQSSSATSMNPCCYRHLDGSSRKAAVEFPGDMKAPSSLSSGPDFFEIIWTNLSYRIPEKRFANLSSSVEGYRNKLSKWWSPNSDQQDSEQSTDNATDYTPSVGSADHSNDGPPLKPPSTGKPRKVIFNNLNGCIKSGELTAILGPSGAGKTTFLKCLTNSIVEGVTGNIDVVGGTTTSHHLKLCIIPQKGEYHHV